MIICSENINRKGSCVGENVDSEKRILQMHDDRKCAKEVVLGKMLIVKNAFCKRMMIEYVQRKLCWGKC